LVELKKEESGGRLELQLPSGWAALPPAAAAVFAAAVGRVWEKSRAM
jgi:hypothetical protein